MMRSAKANYILEQLNKKHIKLGDIRALAKEIKKDQQLAIELWASGSFYVRQLAILIMDKKALTPDLIDSLVEDIHEHSDQEQLQLIDWLFANQLAKDKGLIDLINSWENSSYALQRRIFWYYQGRLRWTGKQQPNSEVLLSKIEQNIEDEEPEVQWAMNFTAGWIGIFEPSLRAQCIALGERTGLYRGQMVSRKDALPIIYLNL